MVTLLGVMIWIEHWELFLGHAFMAIPLGIACWLWLGMMLDLANERSDETQDMGGSKAAR